MQHLVTPPALARLLGVAEATVYRWIKSGRLPRPAVSIGGARGYYMHDVSHILTQFAREATEPRSEVSQ